MFSFFVYSVCVALLCTTVNTLNLERIYENLETIPMGSDDVLTLNVAYNHLTHLDSHVFYNNCFKNIQKLMLFRNKIARVSVDAFKGLKRLKFLDMSDNNLSLLDPYMFKTNTKLEKLVLMNNDIYFDRLQTFLVSHTVETLNLSNNKIVEVYAVTFLGLPNLKRLVLSDNELITLAPISFKSLRKLQYLSLANTGVHKLSESMFIKLPSIINVDNTPLAKSFEPPLQQLNNESMHSLFNIKNIVFN